MEGGCARQGMCANWKEKASPGLPLKYSQTFLQLPAANVTPLSLTSKLNLSLWERSPIMWFTDCILPGGYLEDGWRTLCYNSCHYRRRWKAPRVKDSQSAGQQRPGLEPASSVSSSRWDTFWTDVRALAALHHNPRALNAGEQVGEAAEGALPRRVSESANWNGPKLPMSSFIWWTRYISMLIHERVFGAKEEASSVTPTVSLSIFIYWHIQTMFEKRRDHNWIWTNANWYTSKFVSLAWGDFFFFCDSTNSWCLSQMMETALPKKKSEKQNFDCHSFTFQSP